MQTPLLAFSLAFASAGNNIAASMAMIAMTTSNSIRVNPFLFLIFFTSFLFYLFYETEAMLIK